MTFFLINEWCTRYVLGIIWLLGGFFWTQPSTSCATFIACCSMLKDYTTWVTILQLQLRSISYFTFIFDRPQWKGSNLVLQPPPHPGSALIRKYQASAQHLLPTQCLQRGLDMKGLYPFENKVERKHWNQQKNAREALSGRDPIFCKANIERQWKSLSCLKRLQCTLKPSDLWLPSEPKSTSLCRSASPNTFHSSLSAHLQHLCDYKQHLTYIYVYLTPMCIYLYIQLPSVCMCAERYLTRYLI